MGKIQNEMFQAIMKEVDNTLEAGKEKMNVDYDKAKEVAKVLTELSTNSGDAESLTNQYIANIKQICNS